MYNYKDQPEEFRRIKDFEDYLVSSKGRVLSLKYERIKFLSGGLKDGNYRLVRLAKPGQPKKVKFSVHRLVATAFIPNPNNYPQVNHIDGNPSNNHVENLEWCTCAMNIQHAVDTGLIQNLKGVRVGQKFTDDEIRQIKLYCKTTSLTNKKIGDIHGCSEGYVSMIRRGLRGFTVKMKTNTGVK